MFRSSSAALLKHARPFHSVSCTMGIGIFRLVKDKMMTPYIHGYTQTIKMAGFGHWAETLASEPGKVLKSPVSLAQNVGEQKDLRQLRDQLQTAGVPDVVNAGDDVPLLEEVLRRAQDRGVVSPPPESGQRIAPHELVENLLQKSERDARINLGRSAIFGVGADKARRELTGTEEVEIPKEYAKAIKDVQKTQAK